MRDVSLKHLKNVKGENLVTKVGFLVLCLDGVVERTLTGSWDAKKIQDWQDDPVLFRYCETKEVLDVVESFTGPNVKVSVILL